MSDRWKERKAWSIDRDARCFEALVRLLRGGRMFHHRGWKFGRGKTVEFFITGPGYGVKQLDLSQTVATRLLKLNLVAASADAIDQVSCEYLLVPPQRRELYEVFPLMENAR